MNNKVKATLIIAVFLFAVLPLTANCQFDEPTPTPEETPTPEPTETGPTPEPTPTPEATATPTPTPTASPTPGASPTEAEPTEEPTPEKTPKHATATPKHKTTKGAIDYGSIETIALIVVIVVVVLLLAFIFLKRRQPSANKLRRMSPSQFQAWVLKKLDGKAPSSSDISAGIHGYTRQGEPISINQTDNVGLNVIDPFAMQLAKRRARSGVIVAFSFSGDAIRAKIRARRSYGMDLQTMTVEEIMYTRGR